ncbi:MAG: rhomboid family intramembrane serine protease [Hyphomicrobiales bacterium]
MPESTANMVIVRRCGTRKDAEHYALVLTAMGMRSLIARREGVLSLLVDPENLGRADLELTAYEAENRARVKSNGTMVQRTMFKPRLEGVLAYWAVLLFFFVAARQGLFDISWARDGAVTAALISEGQIWRAVTALTLHLDSAHLISNLVFGTFIGIFLAQVTGTGVAWLGMVVFGAIGNFINALVQPQTHSSIGASTAIFAGLGLLTALRQDWRATKQSFRLRAWAPLASGLAMLAFLGFGSDGRVDILAHIFGFAAGLCGGWFFSSQDLSWLKKPEKQVNSAAFCVFLLFSCWSSAILLNQ